MNLNFSEFVTKMPLPPTIHYTLSTIITSVPHTCSKNFYAPSKQQSPPPDNILIYFVAFLWKQKKVFDIERKHGNEIKDIRHEFRPIFVDFLCGLFYAYSKLSSLSIVCHFAFCFGKNKHK